MSFISMSVFWFCA